jgi:hypothetical protein
MKLTSHDPVTHSGSGGQADRYSAGPARTATAATPNSERIASDALQP